VVFADEETKAFNHCYNGASVFLINKQVLIVSLSMAVFLGVIDPQIAARK